MIKNETPVFVLKSDLRRENNRKRKVTCGPPLSGWSRPMFPVILQHCPLILPPVALLITDTAAEKQEPTILKYPL